MGTAANQPPPLAGAREIPTAAVVERHRPANSQA